MTVHPYLHKKVVLTSKHKKLKLIKPAFDENGIVISETYRSFDITAATIKLSQR